MEKYRRALLALICMSGAANAGSPGLGFVEPQVTNFRTVAAALWEEDSTYYVGLHLNRHSTSLSGIALPYTSGTTRPMGISFPGQTSGFTPGVVVGARRMAHGFVVGAEFRYNAAPDATQDELTYRSIGGGFFEGELVEERIVQRASIGADAGLRFVLGREMSGMRLYGALGISAASVTTSIETDRSANEVPTELLPPQTRNMVGLHWALGMEVQATERMSVRFEYSQTNYGNFAYNLRNTSTGLPPIHRIGAASQRLTVGAIFEF
jgi:opacity protein-like surface antigen